MLQWVVLGGAYLWLGFTVGYFFRKWLELSFVPRARQGHSGPLPIDPRHAESPEAEPSQAERPNAAP